MIDLMERDFRFWWDNQRDKDEIPIVAFLFENDEVSLLTFISFPVVTSARSLTLYCVFLNISVYFWVRLKNKIKPSFRQVNTMYLDLTT
jgi:hypothetical protein